MNMKKIKVFWRNRMFFGDTFYELGWFGILAAGTIAIMIAFVVRDGRLPVEAGIWIITAAVWIYVVFRVIRAYLSERGKAHPAKDVERIYALSEEQIQAEIECVRLEQQHYALQIEKVVERQQQLSIKLREQQQATERELAVVRREIAELRSDMDARNFGKELEFLQKAAKTAART